MTQEDIYDEKVSPLVKQIIEVCKEHKMPCVLSFACPDDKDGESSLMCTTAMLEDHFIGSKDRLRKALKMLRSGDAFAIAMTVSSK